MSRTLVVGYGSGSHFWSRSNTSMRWVRLMRSTDAPRPGAVSSPSSTSLSLRDTLRSLGSQVWPVKLSSPTSRMYVDRAGYRISGVSSP